MTQGETLYLLLVVVTFLVFMGALAYSDMVYRHAGRQPNPVGGRAIETDNTPASFGA